MALVFPLTVHVRVIAPVGREQVISFLPEVSPGMTGRIEPAAMNNEYSKQHSKEKCKLCIQ